FLIYREAGDGIVAGVGSEQKATIRRENDTGRTLEVVRPVNVVNGAQFPGTGAAGRDTFLLGKRAVRRPTVVDEGVLPLVGLHVEIPASTFLRWRGGRFRRSNSRENGSGCGDQS